MRYVRLLVAEILSCRHRPKRCWQAHSADQVALTPLAGLAIRVAVESSRGVTVVQQMVRSRRELFGASRIVHNRRVYRFQSTHQSKAFTRVPRCMSLILSQPSDEAQSLLQYQDRTEEEEAYVDVCTFQNTRPRTKRKQQRLRTKLQYLRMPVHSPDIQLQTRADNINLVPLWIRPFRRRRRLVRQCRLLGLDVVQRVAEVPCDHVWRLDTVHEPRWCPRRRVEVGGRDAVDARGDELDEAVDEFGCNLRSVSGRTTRRKPRRTAAASRSM